MPDAREFVQFIHPGGEHGADKTGRCQWNMGNHRRKFLRGPGTFLKNGGIEHGPIEFWGEWEPPSDVQRIEAPIQDGPQFVHHPFWQERRTYFRLQNTDPFVFGDKICYAVCKQRKGRGGVALAQETCLCRLTEGSVILFGSRVGHKFALDTVFVVKSWVEHSMGSYSDLAELIDPTYLAVTFKPWYAWVDNPALKWRLYFGATVDDDVEGMFSFFPCKEAAGSGTGFCRPAVELPGVVNPELQRGKRDPYVAPDRFADLWRTVRRQVENQGLLLGLSAAMPPKR